jgi:hypothetical protein
MQQDLNALFAIFSRRCGYFIVFSKSHETAAMRTFLVGPTQDRDRLLTREVPATVALIEIDGPINCIKAFDSTVSVNCRQLTEKLGIEAASADLIESTHTDPEVLGDCAGPVDFAIAYGAALLHPEKTQSVNFRDDFMPYQGKKVRLQKALKFLSISVVALCFAMGMYFQSQLLQKNRYRAQLLNKFEKQYSAVMFGQKLPDKIGDAVRKLGGVKRRVQDVKSGQLSITGEESVSSKLTMVLEAFNKCAAKTDLEIDSITVTTKTISITGNTSNRRNTLYLFEAIKDKLDILQQGLDSKGERDNFRVTVVPKK